MISAKVIFAILSAIAILASFFPEETTFESFNDNSDSKSCILFAKKRTCPTRIRSFLVPSGIRFHISKVY